MWHRDMKIAKVFEKMMAIDLIQVALPQILNLFKKKKKVLSSKHNQMVYAYTFFWVLLNTQLP